MSVLRIKKLRENAIIPNRATPGSAGMDLYACIDSPITIAPGERKSVPTGLSIAPENESFVSLIYARSGLSVKKGITLSNCVGVIDSDYRGELIIGLINLSSESYTVEPDERIAQLVIMPVCLPEIVVTDELDDTERGSGGFGSSGNK